MTTVSEMLVTLNKRFPHAEICKEASNVYGPGLARMAPIWISFTKSGKVKDVWVGSEPTHLRANPTGVIPLGHDWLVLVQKRGWAAITELLETQAQPRA